MPDTCAACSAPVGDERTTVRRADGTVRFVLCNACFEVRFCAACRAYFPSALGRQEHRCPN